MIQLYDRLKSRCNSTNQINRLHIALEKQITPDEVINLSDHLASQQRDSWLNGLAGKVFGRLDRRLPAALVPDFRDKCRSQVRDIYSKRRIDALRKRLPSESKGCQLGQGFERKTVQGSIRLYSAAGSKADKTLFVGLAGNGGRLMIPFPFLLACLDSSTIDVALLRTRKTGGFRDGVLGLSANTLEESVSEIEKTLQCSRYRRIVLLGTSAGALPSIYLATRLNADAVLAVGANSPDDKRWTTFLQGRDMRSWLLGPCMEDPARKPEIYLMAGQGHKRNVQTNDRLNDLVGATAVIQVPNCGHCPLHPLFLRHALDKLLSETILAKHTNIPGLTGNVMYE